MQSKKSNADPNSIYGPNPATERAYASCLSISPDGKWMAYCVANVIVLRSFEDLTTIRVYEGHLVKTSAISFSPNKVFAASADIEGNIKIWFLDDFTLKKNFANALGGKIMGLDWNDESNLLFFYGEGKQCFARCINWDTGNNNGEVAAHSKVILTGSLRKIRPFKIATGSEDFQVNFYEGTPFKFKNMHKEHANFVSCVRYSPDNSKFVSVAFDKKIVLYDGKEGKLLNVIANDKTEGNHRMAIINFCWLDNSKIVTVSLDRTVKIWDVDEQTLKMTLFPKKKDCLDVPESACAIATNGTYLVYLALSGKLYFWKVGEISEGKLADVSIDGHQNFITSVLENKTRKEIVSADSNGRILAWDAEKGEKLIGNYGRKVIEQALTPSKQTLITLDGSPVVTWFNFSEWKQSCCLKLQGEPIGLAPSRSEEGKCVVLLSNSITVVKDGEELKSIKLNFSATAIEVNDTASEIYIGDREGNIRVFDLDLKEINKSKIHHSEVTVIKLSNSCELIASGDNAKNIYIWKSSNKEVVCDRFVFHSAKIFSICWSSDDSMLASASLDKSVILWNLADKKRIKTYSDLDIEVVYSVSFINDDSEFICGGHSCCLKRFAF